MIKIIPILFLTLMPVILRGNEIYVDIPDASALVLGSGVDLKQPTSSIPSCFDYEDKMIGSPKLDSKFTTKITIAFSEEEINRSIKKDMALSASYGKIKANMRAWENSNSSNKISSLYLLLESNAIGARIEASNIKPKSNRENLLNNGAPNDILKNCGSHVAIMEHRGRKLRVIFDLSQADQSTKQEIGMAFSAQAKFTVFKASASANYVSNIQKLSKDGKIRLLIDGSGKQPSEESVKQLVQTKPNFYDVGEALKTLLGSTGGDNDSNVAFGLTLQPIRYYAPAASNLLESKVVLDSLKKAEEYEEILRAKKEIIVNELLVAGIDEVKRSELKKQSQEISKSIIDLADTVEKCINSTANVNSCESLEYDWPLKVRDTLKSKIELEINQEKGIYLKSNIPIDGQGTFVVSFPGKDIALETVNISAGEQSIPIIVKTKTNDKKTSVTALMPLLVSSIGMSKFLKMISNDPSEVFPSTVELGCYGGNLGRQIYRIILNQQALPTDSICKTPFAFPSFGLPIPEVTFGEGFAAIPVLMPPGYEAIQFNPSIGDVRLTLRLLDKSGGQINYLLTNDLAKFQME